MGLPLRLVTLGLLVASCPGSPPAPAIGFEDIAGKAGLKFEYATTQAAFHQPELMVGGVAVLDYNNDGCMDIFFTNGAAMPACGKPAPNSNRLFRNNCNDVHGRNRKSRRRRRRLFHGRGHRRLRQRRLHRHLRGGGSPKHPVSQPGERHFEDVYREGRIERRGNTETYGRFRPAGSMMTTMAGWTSSSPTTWTGMPPMSRAAAPRSGNSTVTLAPITGLPGQLFRNNHDGTFTDVSRQSGIGRTSAKAWAWPLPIIDGDGFTDIFVANDSMPNFLFHNQGDGISGSRPRSRGGAARRWPGHRRHGSGFPRFR